MNNYDERVFSSTDIYVLSREICKEYNIGNYISSELITVGYEDYNFILVTDLNK